MATEQQGKPQIRADKEECPRKRCREKFQHLSGAGVRWGVRWEGVGWGWVRGGGGQRVGTESVWTFVLDKLDGPG